MASFNKSINFRRTSIYPSITNNKFIPSFAHSNLLKSIFSKTIQPLSLSATSLSIHIFQKRVVPSHCHFYATTSTFLLYQSMANKDDKQIHHFGNEMSTYELAVSRLNALQSNAQVTAKLQNRKQITETNIQITKDCLHKLGISLDQIDQLNVVHITGTKGKGSTAAFLECILRSLGYKTGLYSSPHLVHVRERIRINGRPISEQYFAEQFFRVYNILQSKRAQNESMPAYFKFLTLLAFRIFCDEQVDVAIMEVGIGGEFDCTNVIQSPVVCAITTLDLDHTRLLGHTIPEIAWHKAGIAKPCSILLSVAQPPEALEVIKKRCSEKECQLLIVPSELTAYNWPQLDIKIGIPGLHHHLNVSLALQLASVWLQRMKGKRIGKNEEKKLMNNLQMEENNFIDDDSPKELRGFGIPPAISEVLAECKWPGRSQLLQRGRILYHLDGAHTPQSLMACTKWFQQTSLTCGNSDNVFRVLIFHCTGDRDPTILLPKFKDCHINLAIFCPTRIDQKPAPLNQDNTNLTIDPESDMRRCERDKAVWTNLNESSEGNLNNRKCISLLLPSISDALSHVDELAKNNKDDIHVLVTGSFHLVGGVLSLLDPECATI